MSSWEPGFRHQVRIDSGYDPGAGRWRYAAWHCMVCGQWFSRWPSDDVECPGPAPTADNVRSVNRRLRTGAGRPEEIQ